MNPHSGEFCNNAALQATRADPARWDRFAATVLAGRDTAANRALLAGAFDRLLAWQDLTARMNDTPLRHGQGRLDAVGHILNKILMFNTGEVLGVFGEIVVTPRPFAAGPVVHYDSSVRTRNLVEMELLVKDLQPPAWPAGFPPIDEGLRQQGEALFAAHCATCHLMPRDQRADRPTERMLAFRDTRPADLTDIWMACNAFVYDRPTGPMKGLRDNNGTAMGDQAPVANMLGTAVRGALIRQAPELVRAGFANIFGIRRLPGIEALPLPLPGEPRADDRRICLTTPDVPTLAYKARPLEGIWATAPYLHNGSVRSLHDLLLPPDRRAREFWLALDGGLSFGLRDALFNIGGLLIGAVETTSHAICNALVELRADPARLAAARDAAHQDGPGFDDHVFEALRFRPAFPYVFRLCHRATPMSPGTPHQATVAPGTTVLAVTHAAMFDAQGFPDPGRFDPGRDLSDSFTFGMGRHIAAMVPEIARQILRDDRLALSPAPDYRGGTVPAFWQASQA